jgi:nitrogen-specific signal transduction histidine kinase
MEMEDPAKVMIAVSLFGSVAYSVGALARAFVAHRKEEARLERESVPPLTEVRLARIEQAVDAIALEVERISEGQRFTTKLLSEQNQRAAKSPSRQLASNTPT